MARGLVIALILISRSAPCRQLTGAGSTFVYPLLAKWAVAYAARTDVRVNYQSIGSGGGIKQIENQTVDFGATDMPLDSATLARRGLLQFPLIAGAIVPVVHVRGLGDGDLKLTGDLLARIYLGEIKRWNDPALRMLNPELTLPDRLITVVHRADGSGTSFVWTSYLNLVSPAWKSRVGAASAVTWPTGVGGKGNEGVAAFVKQTEGAIGYVESAFARRARLATARLMNRERQFKAAAQPSFEAAVDTIDWSSRPDYDVSLVDAPGPDSWPIAGATFVLMRRESIATDQARAALDFFAWAFSDGAALARELDYVPLPAALQRRVIAGWRARAPR